MYESVPRARLGLNESPPDVVSAVRPIRATVTVYVFVVVPSCAVTTMVIVVEGVPLTEPNEMLEDVTAEPVLATDEP